MTHMTHGSESAAGGRLGSLALRLVLAVILASPIGVGFWLAPKADNMPTPPELTAPPSTTSLPDAVRRVLPTLGQDQTTARPTTIATGG